MPVPGHTSGPHAATENVQKENSDTTSSDLGNELSIPRSAVMFATTKPTKQSGESDEAGVYFLQHECLMFIHKIMPFKGLG